MDSYSRVSRGLAGTRTREYSLAALHDGYDVWNNFSPTASSCGVTEAYNSFLENQLQILTPSMLGKESTRKTYLISMKNLSDLEKSIDCAAVGRNIKILKNGRKILFFF